MATSWSGRQTRIFLECSKGLARLTTVSAERSKEPQLRLYRKACHESPSDSSTTCRIPTPDRVLLPGTSAYASTARSSSANGPSRIAA